MTEQQRERDRQREIERLRSRLVEIQVEVEEISRRMDELARGAPPASASASPAN